MVLRLGALLLLVSASAAQEPKPERPWWVVLLGVAEEDTALRSDGKAQRPAARFAERLPSPDGKHLLWAMQRDKNRDIFLSDKQGKNVRRLTRHAAMDSGPTWAPDGKRIAFDSGRSGKREIWIKSIDADAGPARRVSITPKGAWFAKFAPTGNRIAYSIRLPHRGKGWMGNVVIHDLDTNKLTLVAKKLLMPSIAWHPDGKRLAVGSINSIRIYDGSKLVTSVDLPKADKRLYAHLPGNLVWRPDGIELACSITFAGGRAAVAFDNAMGENEVKVDRLYGDREVFFMTPEGKLRAIEVRRRGVSVRVLRWAR